MQSTSAEFSDHQNWIGGARRAILELTDGVTTWYFSDKQMDLEDGFVHELLQPNWRIAQSINIYTKRWAISTLSVTLLNRTYKKDTSNNWTKLSAEIGSVRFNTAKLYLIAGQRISRLSQCLVAFSGVIIKPPICSTTSIKIQVEDAGKVKNLVLPQNRISATFPNAPVGFLPKKIPIAYGKYDYETTHYNDSGNGLAMAIPTSTNRTQYVVGDHTANAMSELYTRHDEFPDLFHFTTRTLNVSDSSRATITAVGAQVEGVVFPSSDEGFADYVDKGSSINNDDVTWDRGTASLCELVNNLVGGSSPGTDPEGILALTFDNDSTMVGLARGYNLKYIIRHVSGEDLSTTKLLKKLRLYYGGDATADAYDEDGFSDSGTTSYADGTSTWKAFNVIDKNKPYAMACYIQGKASEANGELTFYRFWAFLLKLQFNMNQYFLAKPGISRWWVAMQGREYGSWITGRSSNYSAGDVIVDPAGIIESILRDELGFADADLNLPTFIDAENTSVEAHINLHSLNEMLAFDVCRQLGEQSTFVFVWMANGKARLIKLNDSSPTTNRTIPYSHIVNGDIIVTQGDTIINKIDVESRYLQEKGSYYDQEIISNGTSAASFGTFVYNARWPNISGSSVTIVTNHLIKDSDAIWANEHNQIQFSTVGFSNADLELGDWVELRSAEVDPHIKCFGTSFSGKQFLVIGLEQKADSTKVTAIELY